MLRDLMFISQMGEPISKPFFVIGRSSLDPVCKDEQKSITSCTLVFRVFPKDAPFQSQVFNLGFKTEAISKGNFPLDDL